MTFWKPAGTLLNDPGSFLLNDIVQLPPPTHTHTGLHDWILGFSSFSLGASYLPILLWFLLCFLFTVSVHFRSSCLQSQHCPAPSIFFYSVLFLLYLTGGFRLSSQWLFSSFFHKCPTTMNLSPLVINSPLYFSKIQKKTFPSENACINLLDSIFPAY